MKKLFAFITCLLMTMGAMADELLAWSILPEYENTNQGQDTWIVGEFITNADDVYYPIADYQIAAFVADETYPRAVVHPTYSTEAGKYIISVQVRGNIDPTAESDEGKPISLVSWHPESGRMYLLKSSIPLTWSETAPTYRPTLTMTVATSVKLDTLVMNVGDNINLTEHMTLIPEGSSLPTNFDITWDLLPSGYATIENNILTANNPTSDTIMYLMTGPYPVTGYGKLFIHLPATGIAINGEASRTFRIGEDESNLNNLLTAGGGYTVTPANTTETVTWEIADTTIIGGSAVTGYTLKKAGTTTATPVIKRTGGQDLRPSNPSTITITVVQPVTDIYFEWNPQLMNGANVGDDVFSRINSLVRVVPDNASNKAYTFTITDEFGEAVGDSVTLTTNSMVFNVAANYIIKAIPSDNPNLPSNSNSMEIAVENPMQSVAFAQNPLTIELDNQAPDFAAQVAVDIINNVSLLPMDYSTADGTVEVSGTALTIDEQTTVLNESGFNIEVTAVSKGTSTITITPKWYDYSNYTGTKVDANYVLGTPQTLTVNIIASLEGFMVTHTPTANNAGTLKFEPYPNDAQFNLSNVQIHIGNSEYPLTWDVINITDRVNNNSDITITYQALLPGYMAVSADDNSGEYTLYNAASADPNNPELFAGLDIPATYSFNTGWQWRSNPYGDMTADANTFFNQTFLNSFSEARSQTNLLINDPSWGLFCNSASFDVHQGDCYKILMSAPASTTLVSGTFPDDNPAIALHGGYGGNGWTWVGSPYFYNRLLTNAVNMNSSNIRTGTRIVSKNSGFAEWNGSAWTGTLTVLEKNQGYLVYSPSYSTENKTLSLNPESDMTQGDETPAGARGFNMSVWNYDDSRFANNMSMVAELKNADNLRYYSIGAFVGDECRGKGELIDGKLFITVHANNGEQVTFRLYNELTDEYLDVKETVKFQQMLGTISNPFALNVDQDITGISQTTIDGKPSEESYDLMGRKNPNTRLSIQRMANGKIRKIVK
jgi:hypothetical protein